MLDTKCVRPIRELDRILAIGFSFGPVDRRDRTLQLFIIKVNPLSIYFNPS